MSHTTCKGMRYCQKVVNILVFHFTWLHLCIWKDIDIVTFLQKSAPTTTSWKTLITTWETTFCQTGDSSWLGSHSTQTNTSFISNSNYFIRVLPPASRLSSTDVFVSPLKCVWLEGLEFNFGNNVSLKSQIWTFLPTADKIWNFMRAMSRAG